MSERVVAVLGAKGMLGTDLCDVLRSRGCRVHAFDLPEFDITDDEQLAQAAASAPIIVNCAAYTNVDGAESETETAHRVNAEAAGRLGRYAAGQDAWVLHVSTDFVFDGTLDRPYTETDTPHPVNEYGRSKLAGESLLAQSGCRHCIIRVEWTYGQAGNNFVSKLLGRAEAQESLNVVDDQVGSPTATTEAAAAISELVARRPEGLFHFAADGYVSRFDMARFVLDLAGSDVDLRPCRTSDYESPATRPLNSRFDCTRISEFLSRQIRPWQEPLADFVDHCCTGTGRTT